MTKQELINKLSENYEGQVSKKMVAHMLDTMFDTISKSIKKEKRFSYPSFGTFEVRNRKARKGRNPQTGAVISIRASKTVGFRPAKALKETL
jgi:DNA-binding protein HU-beta